MPFLTTRETSPLSNTTDSQLDSNLNANLYSNSSSSSASGSSPGSGSSSSAPFPTATIIAIGFGGLAALIIGIGAVIVVRSKILAWNAEIKAAKQRLALAQNGFGDEGGNGTTGGNINVNGNRNGSGNGNGNGNGNGSGGTLARLPSVKRLKPLSFLQGREGPKEWEIREKLQRTEDASGAGGVMRRLSRASSSARKSIKSHAGKLQRSLSRKSSTKTESDGHPASAIPSSSRAPGPSRATPMPNRTRSPPGPSSPPKSKLKPALSLHKSAKGVNMDDEISMSVLRYIGDSPKSSPRYPPSVSKDRVYDPTRDISIPSPRNHHTRDISNTSSVSASATAVSGNTGYVRRPSDANIYPIYEDETRPSMSSQNTRYNPSRMVQPSHDRNASNTSNTSATIKGYTNINPVAIVTTGVQSARERRDTLSILSPITPKTASTPSTFTSTSPSNPSASSPSAYTTTASASSPSAYSQSTHAHLHTVPVNPNPSSNFDNRLNTSGNHTQATQTRQFNQVNYPYQSFAQWNDGSGSPTMPFSSYTLSQRRPAATTSNPSVQRSQTQTQARPKPQPQYGQPSQNQYQYQRQTQPARRPSVEIAPILPLNIQKRPSEVPSLSSIPNVPFELSTPTAPNAPDTYVHPYARVDASAVSHSRTGSQTPTPPQMLHIRTASHTRTDSLSNLHSLPQSHPHSHSHPHPPTHTHTRTFSNTNPNFNTYSPKRPITTTLNDHQRQGSNASNSYPRRI